MKTFCFLIVVAFAGSASAKILLDADLAYLLESRSSSSTSSRTGSFYSGGLLVDATGKERLYLGAMMAVGGVTGTGVHADSFSHQDVILAGRWFVDRQKILSMSLGYGFTSRAELKESSTSPTEKWNGTSFYGKITIAPEFRRWNLGVSLIYHQGNYVEKTIQGTTSKASLQRTMMWPALSLDYRW